MVCPKCGFSKATGNECNQCGVIFSKYFKAQERKAARLQEKKKSLESNEGEGQAHPFDQADEQSPPEGLVGIFLYRNFKEPYSTPWKPVGKGKMIGLSVFFILIIYLISQETFYRLYPESNIIDSFIIRVFSRVNLVFHEAGHWIFAVTGNRTLTILGGSFNQVLVPLLVCFTFWRNRDATGLGFGLVWMFMNFLEVGRYMADARKPVLPLIGGMDPYGSHDWINLFNRWDLWSYDTAIAKLTWTLGWIGIIGTVLWHSWIWLTVRGDNNDTSNNF
jgi:hypothetical protein